VLNFLEIYGHLHSHVVTWVIYYPSGQLKSEDRYPWYGLNGQAFKKGWMGV